MSQNTTYNAAKIFYFQVDEWGGEKQKLSVYFWGVIVCTLF